jgi:type III pantothenate kinase
MKTLCLDFGNTRQKCVLFNDAVLEAEFTLDAGPASLGKILEQYSPEKAILSSVIDHHKEYERLLEDKTDFHKLSSASKLPFKLAISKKETVGSDRLALVAGASRFFPGLNTLIIGMGTCITYNFLNQYNVFLGGAISPGVEMRFRSMKEFTAKLPLAEFTDNIPFTGYDTMSSLQVGVIHGITSEIEGIITNYKEKYSNFNVVLTGGNSAYFAGELKKKIFADLNFLFKGLYALSEINCEKL